MAWWHEKAVGYEKRVQVKPDGETVVKYVAILEKGGEETRTRQTWTKARQAGVKCDVVVQVEAGQLVRFTENGQVVKTARGWAETIGR